MKEQISARGSSAGKGGGAGKVAKVGICKSDCDFFFRIPAGKGRAIALKISRSIRSTWKDRTSELEEGKVEKRKGGSLQEE